MWSWAQGAVCLGILGGFGRHHPQALAQVAVGFGVLATAAYGLSEKRRDIAWKAVLNGLTLNLLLMAMLLKIPVLRAGLLSVGKAVDALKAATSVGTSFVLGHLGGGPAPFDVAHPENGFIFAFHALPLVMVIGAIAMVLFHWGVIPKAVSILSVVFERVLGLKGPISVFSAAKLVFGQSDAPLVVRPYLASMSRQSLLMVMSAGMATGAATLIPLYCGLLEPFMGAEALMHVLIAAVVNIVAALTFARVLIPETASAHAPVAETSRAETERFALGLDVRTALLAFPLVGWGAWKAEPICEKVWTALNAGLPFWGVCVVGVALCGTGWAFGALAWRTAQTLFSNILPQNSVQKRALRIVRISWMVGLVLLEWTFIATFSALGLQFFGLESALVVLGTMGGAAVLVWFFEKNAPIHSTQNAWWWRGMTDLVGFLGIIAFLSMMLDTVEQIRAAQILQKHATVSLTYGLKIWCLGMASMAILSWQRLWGGFSKQTLERLNLSATKTALILGFFSGLASLLSAYSFWEIEATTDLWIQIILGASALSMAIGFLAPRFEAFFRSHPIETPYTFSNTMDALAQGTMEGFRLISGVAAMLIVSLAVVALINTLLGAVLPWPVRLEDLFGMACAPLVWIMGIEPSQVQAAGHVLGTKLVLNEIAALIGMKGVNGTTCVPLVYALCNFGNVSSIAIQMGGLGALIPERRADIAALGGRALLASILAGLSSGMLARLMI